SPLPRGGAALRGELPPLGTLQPAARVRNTVPPAYGRRATAQGPRKAPLRGHARFLATAQGPRKARSRSRPFELLTAPRSRAAEPRSAASCRRPPPSSRRPVFVT